MFFSISACTPDTAQTTQFTASASGELDIDPSITIKINNVIAATRPVVFNSGDVVTATVVSSAQYLGKDFYQYQLNGTTQYFAVVTKNDYNIKVKSQYSSSRWYNFRPETHKLSIKRPGAPLAPITLTPDLETTPLPMPVLVLSATTLTFDSTAVGTTTTATVTITNTGNAPWLVGNTNILGADPAYFSVAGCATALLTDQSCTLTVTFAPTSPGIKTATLSIAHNAANSPSTIALSGLALAPVCNLSANSLNIVETTIGSTNTGTVTISNTGNAPLVISNIAVASGDYTATGCVGTLAAGASCILSVTFAPTTTGTKTATVTIMHNAIGGATAITVSSTAVAFPIISLGATSLALGAALPGVTTTDTLVITNTGTASLVISGLTIEGADASEYSASGCTAAISAGQTCTLSVIFAPTTTGTKIATLSIAHNAANSPSTVALNGTGTTGNGNNWAVAPFVVSSSGAAPSTIAYGNGTFVALPYYVSGTGNSRAGYYSTDGISWATTLMPTYPNISVTYGAGKFVAINANGSTACYSTDGINWATTTLPVSTNWGAVAYGDGKFVAVARTRPGSTDATSLAAYSTDGITWTQTSMSVSTTWWDIVYGNGKFVALGYSKSAYSTNGITWTEITSGAPRAAAPGAIAYGNGKFVVVAQGNSSYIWYSTDGINWATVPMNLGTYWQAVTYGAGKFVGLTSNKVLLSSDGINWTLETTALSSNATQRWYAITYSAGKYVATRYTASSIGTVTYSS